MISLTILIVFIILIGIIAAALRANSVNQFDKARKDNDEYNEQLRSYLFGDEQE